MNARHGTHVILGAITPSYNAIDADELSYPNLAKTLGLYSLPGVLRSGNLFSKGDSLKSKMLREDIAVAYFLTAAYRLQKAWTPPSKIFWSNQLTLTSVKLFGRPLSGEVAKLAHDELRYFERIAEQFPAQRDFFDPVLRAYGSLVKQRIEVYPSIEVKYGDLLRQVRELYNDQYHDVLKIFDEHVYGELLQPAEVANQFAGALEELKIIDPTWNGWKVSMDGGAKLRVNAVKRSIVVGRKRAPISTKEIKGLFAHEVLIHAFRSIEGRKYASDLALGLPGYTVAEEGLGVLVESAINGQLSPKIKDRYVDIALALGSGRRRPLSRNELFEFCYSRAVIRSIVNGEDVSLDLLESTVWEHVNRIYRGSLGNHYVGVFTKDVAYYKGFVKIARYLERRSKKIGLQATFEYLMRGKFDPTNPLHSERVQKSTKNRVK